MPGQADNGQTMGNKLQQSSSGAHHYALAAGRAASKLNSVDGDMRHICCSRPLATACPVTIFP